MLISDLLHSCAYECVAEAAVASIGGDLVDKLQAEADDRGVSLGFLASSLVRGFAREASERDWRDLVDATRGHDFPVLSGLNVILTKPRRTRAPQFRPVGAGARMFSSAYGEELATPRDF